MSTFQERAFRYRNDPNVHYNCAQSVVLSFTEDLGIDKGPAKAIAANFGAGMYLFQQEQWTRATETLAR